MVRLIPRDEKFLAAFIEDAENLLAAARALEAMLASYDRLDERVAEIQTLEKRGDEIDRDIAARLERSFITPFDRDDIHTLAVQLDDVVDLIQSAAETCVIYDISAPTPEMQRLAAILAKQAERCSRRSGCSTGSRAWPRISFGSTSWSTRPTPCRARRSAAVPGADGPARRDAAA